MNETRFDIGREVELAIDGYTSEGDGVGRSAGAVFFVPGALAGERVRARVTEARKNFYRAEAIAFAAGAPARRTPPCPLFGECGGCRLQHMAYPEQLVFKEKRVRDALERIGGIPGERVAPIRGMENPWRYRNKATFTAGEKDGRPILGFLREGSREVIDVGDCLLADESAGRVARAARQLGLQAGGGRVARVTVRTAASSGRRLVVIETAERPLVRGIEIAERLLAAEPSVAGVVGAVRAAKPGGRERYALLAGAGGITETLSGIAFWISAGTFFQVNSRQAEALYGRAAELAGNRPGARVLDAYCGAGGFALFLARRAESVLGVESDAEAVRDAAENARRNGFANVRFAVGDLEKRFDRLSGSFPNITDVVVDPPAPRAHPAIHRRVRALLRPARSLRESAILPPWPAIAGRCAKRDSRCGRRPRSTCSRKPRTWKAWRSSSASDLRQGMATMDRLNFRSKENI